MKSEIAKCIKNSKIIIIACQYTDIDFWIKYLKKNIIINEDFLFNLTNGKEYNNFYTITKTVEKNDKKLKHNIIGIIDFDTLRKNKDSLYKLKELAVIFDKTTINYSGSTRDIEIVYVK